MQCGWLAFTTYLLTMIVNHNSLKRTFSKEPDPKRVGIRTSFPKQKPAAGMVPMYTSSIITLHLESAMFVEELQRQSLKIFNNLQKCLLRLVKPLLAPAILDRPSHPRGDREREDADSCIPRDCIKSTADIVFHLEGMLDDLEAHKIFPVVIKQVFVQTFYALGAHTFNLMMEESRYCTYSNAFQIKLAIADLLSWVSSRSKILAQGRTRYISCTERKS